MGQLPVQCHPLCFSTQVAGTSKRCALIFAARFGETLTEGNLS